MTLEPKVCLSKYLHILIMINGLLFTSLIYVVSEKHMH